MAEARKATDATGKGIEEDPYAKRSKAASNYKPKIPAKGPTDASGKKIPKWKLQSM